MAITVFTWDWKQAVCRETFRVGLCAVLCFLPRGAMSVGVFDKLVLFSEVNGVVLKDGVPVGGAEVVQKIDVSKPNNVPPRSVVTDANGAFAFDTVSRSAGLRRMIPHEPSISQRLIIKYDGVEYEGWHHGKHSYEMNSELGGRALKLVCDLSTKPDFEGKHYGICRVSEK